MRPNKIVVICFTLYHTLPQFSDCNLSFSDTGTHNVPFSFWLHFHLLEELSKYLV